MTDREGSAPGADATGVGEVDENAEVSGDAGDIDELNVPEGADD